MGSINTTVAYAYATTNAVSATPLALVDIAPLTAEDVQQAQRLRLTCSTTGIRYRYDGGDPTTSAGHFLAANGETLLVGNQNIRQLRLIRNGGSDATIAVTLER